MSDKTDSNDHRPCRDIGLYIIIIIVVVVIMRCTRMNGQSSEL